MALENLRVTERINEDDPRFVEAMEAAEPFELELHRNQWYVRDTREPVMFSCQAEARRWFRDHVRVGDYIEVADWDRCGKITHITEDFIRLENRRAKMSWRLDPDFVEQQLVTWKAA